VTNEQWELARRNQERDLAERRTAVDTIRGRLALPTGTPGEHGRPGGYASRAQWQGTSRRPAGLEDRAVWVQVDRDAGVVHVARGGGAFARQRHHLDAAGRVRSSGGRSRRRRAGF
jgi:hypothetical protein